MENKIVARYMVNAAFLNGVPARDLTQAEWDALDKGTQQACLQTGLYELVPATDAAGETPKVEEHA